MLLCVPLTTPVYTCILASESLNFLSRDLRDRNILFEFPQLDQDEGLYQHGLIHIESQSKLLLFGGYRSNGEYMSEIW